MSILKRSESMNNENVELLERRIRRFLEQRGIPFQRYDNLSAYFKDVLRNRLAVPCRNTTDLELSKLYLKLRSPDVVGRGSIDQVNLPSSAELEEFFTIDDDDNQTPSLF